MSKFLSLAVLCFVISGLVACGGGSSTPAPTPTPTPAATIVVTPGSATVALGGSQTFTANATGVTWTLSGPGSINANGVYLAPGTFPSGASTATVTATTGGKTGSASIQVVYSNDNGGNQTPPVKLGTSGGNVNDNNTANTACCIGTLGSLMQRGTTFFILSNNHVMARSSVAQAGENIDQPGQPGCPGGSQGLHVADLTSQATLKPTANETTGTCQGSTAPLCGHAPTNVDAAIAQIVATTVDLTGSILDLGAAGATSIAAAPPSSTLETAPTAGEGVAKSGRTTGLTCSTIGSTNTTVIVSYDSSCGGSTAFDAYFNNQVIVNGGSFSAGGDSGSLIVTSNNARPVALLYAGNSTSTAGNPISDVLAAFNNGTAPTIMGGSDHAVSCLPTASNAAKVVPSAPASVPLSAKEQARAGSALAGMGNALTRDAAVNDVKIGTSADSAGEAALVIELRGTPKAAIPAMIGGVRTRILYPSTMTVSRPSAETMKQAVAVKEAHVNSLMAQKGIQGVGVGLSDDNPAEPAIVIYALQGVARQQLPAVIDGIRTKVVEGDRFRAYGWNEKPGVACVKPKPAATAKPKLKAKLK